MKIRITGNSEELKAITELLKSKEYIRSISTPYKNRGEYNKDYRLYIETYDMKPEQFKEISPPEPQEPEIKQENIKSIATQPEQKHPAEAPKTALNGKYTITQLNEVLKKGGYIATHKPEEVEAWGVPYESDSTKQRYVIFWEYYGRTNYKTPVCYTTDLNSCLDVLETLNAGNKKPSVSCYSAKLLDNIKRLTQSDYLINIFGDSEELKEVKTQ